MLSNSFMRRPQKKSTADAVKERMLLEEQRRGVPSTPTKRSHNAVDGEEYGTPPAPKAGRTAMSPASTVQSARSSFEGGLQTTPRSAYQSPTRAIENAETSRFGPPNDPLSRSNDLHATFDRVRRQTQSPLSLLEQEQDDASLKHVDPVHSPRVLADVDLCTTKRSEEPGGLPNVGYQWSSQELPQNTIEEIDLTDEVSIHLHTRLARNPTEEADANADVVNSPRRSPSALNTNLRDIPELSARYVPQTSIADGVDYRYPKEFSVKPAFWKKFTPRQYATFAEELRAQFDPVPFARRLGRTTEEVQYVFEAVVCGPLHCAAEAKRRGEEGMQEIFDLMNKYGTPTRAWGREGEQKVQGEFRGLGPGGKVELVSREGHKVEMHVGKMSSEDAKYLKQMLSEEEYMVLKQAYQEYRKKT